MEADKTYSRDIDMSSSNIEVCACMQHLLDTGKTRKYDQR